MKRDSKVFYTHLFSPIEFALYSHKIAKFTALLFIMHILYLQNGLAVILHSSYLSFFCIFRFSTINLICGGGSKRHMYNTYTCLDKFYLTGNFLSPIKLSHGMVLIVYEEKCCLDKLIYFYRIARSFLCNVRFFDNYRYLIKIKGSVNTDALKNK